MEENEGFAEVRSKSTKRKFDEMASETPTSAMDTGESKPIKPNLGPLSSERLGAVSTEIRKIPVPPHRYTPLKENWPRIVKPLVENLRLKVRFNLRTRNVELMSHEATTDVGSLQKGADFVKAFTLGFQVEDALALARLDDLYLDSFDVTDVKPLKGDHLSRAIGRIAGKGGKTKFTIENSTKTRIVLADSKVHILGSYQNTLCAKRTICQLILGSKPTTVYGHMKVAARRLADA